MRNMNSLRTPNLFVTSATFCVSTSVIDDIYSDLEIGRSVVLDYSGMGHTVIRRNESTYGYVVYS